MQLKITYNPLSFEFSIFCTDNVVLGNLDSTILNLKNDTRPILDWIESFIKKFKAEANGEDFKLTVEGCDSYEKMVIEDIICNIPDVRITLDILAKDDKIRNDRQNIDNFFQYVYASTETVIQEAYEAHKRNVQELSGTKINIPIIATMSSGKSTLINALLGVDILPAKNEPTTATTCEILINNSLENFRGELRRSNGSLVEEKGNIKNSDVEKWNDQANKGSYSIFLEGPAKKIL